MEGIVVHDHEEIDYESDDYFIKLDRINYSEGLEPKIGSYVRLYTSFINAGRKFLLAHNTFVSVFNLIKDQWV